jgi:hypothetical protein
MVASAITGCGNTSNNEATEAVGVEATETTETAAETKTEAEETERGTEIASETENGTEEDSEAASSDTETADDANAAASDTETADDAEAKKDDAEKNSSGAAQTTTASEESTHTHAWDGGTITQAATCTSNGVKTYKCSCGQTKTEAINASGHNWVAQTTTVHHDAEGQYQEVKTGDRKVVICNDDKECFYDNESWQAHSNTYGHPRFTLTYEDTYETQWVETQAAYDETITTGYICSVCGATQ